MYRLFSRIPKGLDPVADIFKEHVEGEGNRLVKEVRWSCLSRLLVGPLRWPAPEPWTQPPPAKQVPLPTTGGGGCREQEEPGQGRWQAHARHRQQCRAGVRSPCH